MVRAAAKRAVSERLYEADEPQDEKLDERNFSNERTNHKEADNICCIRLYPYLCGVGWSDVGAGGACG